MTTSRIRSEINRQAHQLGRTFTERATAKLRAEVEAAPSEADEPEVLALIARVSAELEGRIDATR